MSPPDLLTAAADLWGRGFSIVPVTPGGKVPAIQWQAYQHRRATMEEIAGWFANGLDYNIGIITGAVSGIVVADADDEAAEAYATAHLPPTPMMVRTARGIHYYYKHPGGIVRNGVKIRTPGGQLALDVRGDGGLVVGPGSRHPSGALYSRMGDWPAVDTLPTFDVTWIAPDPPPPPPTFVEGSVYTEGQRNDRLTREAGRLRRLGWRQDEILGALKILNATRCAPPLAEREVAGIAASVARYPAGTDAPASPFVVLSDVEVLARPDPPALVEGHFYEGALIGAYGPSGIGKTLTIFGLCASIGTQRPWYGWTIPRGGACVFVLAEGTGGLPARVRAWRAAYGIPPELPLNVHFVTVPVYLDDPGQVSQFIDVIAALAPRTVVFDPLARNMVGDENSAQDVMRVVAGADRVVRELHSTVCIVHHSNKAGTAERGSSALRAAATTMVAFTAEDDLLVLRCDKQRDADPFESIELRLDRIADTGSVVFRPAHEVATSENFSPSQRRAYDELKRFGTEGATSTAWLKAFGMSERHYYRAKDTLLGRGLVKKVGPRFYIAGLDPQPTLLTARKPQ